MQYDIAFYNPVQAFGSGTDLRTFTGLPYVKYRVQRGATATTLQITSYTRTIISATDVTAPIVRTAVTSVARTGTAPMFSWKRNDWNTSGATQLREMNTGGSGTTTSRSESMTIETPGGGAVARRSTAYTQYSWGEEATATQEGEGSFGLTSAISYYDDATTPGSRGLTASAVEPGGGWTAFDYWNTTSVNGLSGAIKYRYRPYRNLPAAPTRDPGQGEVTYYEYTVDEWGAYTRPTVIQTSLNGTVVAKSTIGYSSAQYPSSSTLFVVTAERHDYTDAGNYLTTVTKYFSGNAGVWTDDAGTSRPAEAFYRSLPVSVQLPDGTKRSFAYQLGSFNESSHAFTVSPTGSASRVAVLTGCGTATAGTLASTYDGFDIDDLYLVANKSTLEVTIRDARALVRRTESYAWDGSAWNLVGAVDYTYDYAGQLTNRISSNGATYVASYSGELLASATDEAALTTTYVYDDAGRIYTSTKTSGPKTTYEYDAANRVLSRTIAATDGSTADTLVSSASYDTAGRLTSTTPPGLGASTYDYDAAARTQTVTAPDGGTTTQSFYLDGSLASVTGSSEVPAKYFTYGCETDGRRYERIDFGTSSSPRWQKTWQDWAGRSLRTERPGFTGQSNYVEENTYALGTGLLARTTRPGSAAVLYNYDVLGVMVRSGLDVGGNGSLDLASNDRISDTATVFENYLGAWWRTTTATGYPTANSGSSVTLSVHRERLTGFAAGQLAEVHDVDADGNDTSVVTTINRSTRTITTTKTGSCECMVSTNTMVNGLPVQTTTRDGLTYQTQFDGLERKSKEIDPRNSNTTVWLYWPGSTLVKNVTDAANNVVSAASYDTSGRPVWTKDAAGQYSYFTFDQRGQLTRRWGSGTYPVAYAYDAIYGERTSMSTYRGGSGWSAATWPSSPGTANTTSWSFDLPSGLPKTTQDAAGKSVQFAYDASGQVVTRTNARAIVTTYGYDGSTRELTSVTYSDATPALGFTYTRLGQIATVADATGTRSFGYGSTTPWRLAYESLPSFFGSRRLTTIYDGEYTAATFHDVDTEWIAGRPVGFGLGVSGNPTRDLTQYVTYSDRGRVIGVTARAGTATAQDFVYSYTPSSRLLAGYATGSFTVAYDYESARDLRTKVASSWASTSLVRFDSTYDAAGRRKSAKQSGSAFSDYYAGQTYSAVYNVYAYDGRGQLQTAAMYHGDTPLSSPTPDAELPGRRFEYRYDNLGNRQTSGPTGSPSGTDDAYTANALNQYTSRENNTVQVLGTAAVSAGVAVGNAASTSRNDRAWAADVLPVNDNGPSQGTVKIYAAIAGGGTGGADLVRTTTASYLVPPAAQAMTYDADGNLTTDSMWTYTYDAENRLTRMASALSSGFTHLRLDFVYDYLGRRVAKTVTDLDTNAQTMARRFIYDGWRLVAELDGTGAVLQRTYAWGLDLSGSREAADGIGALLRITNYSSGAPGTSYFPAGDANGNIAALVNGTSGALAAVYEYDPFGNLLRREIVDPAVADNPFGFSTRYTDRETGLSYYGLRYYSPALGRFVNRDPIGEEGGLNLYAFVGNSPVSRWDFRGMEDPPVVLPDYWIFVGSSGGGSLAGALIHLHGGRHYGGIAALIRLLKAPAQKPSPPPGSDAPKKPWQPNKTDCDALRSQYSDLFKEGSEKFDSPLTAFLAAEIDAGAFGITAQAEVTNLVFQRANGSYGYIYGGASDPGSPGEAGVNYGYAPEGSSVIAVAHNHNVGVTSYVAAMQRAFWNPDLTNAAAQYPILGELFSYNDMRIPFSGSRPTTVGVFTPSGDIRAYSNRVYGPPVNSKDTSPGYSVPGAPSKDDALKIAACKAAHL